jgi:hypothetical protein
MFRTVTANPLLVTQGSHLCISQEQVDEKKKVQRRYVILDSETLETQTFETKELYDAAVADIIEAHQKPKKKSSPLDELGALEVVTDVPADIAAGTEEDDDSVQA